jgi:hypothetical protein
MMLPVEGYLLRIFIGESDRHDGKLLYEWIVLSCGFVDRRLRHDHNRIHEITRTCTNSW